MSLIIQFCPATACFACPGTNNLWQYCGALHLSNPWYYGHKHYRKFYNMIMITATNGSGSNNIKRYEIQTNPVEKLVKQKVDANIQINNDCQTLLKIAFNTLKWLHQQQLVEEIEKSTQGSQACFSFINYNYLNYIQKHH